MMHHRGMEKTDVYRALALALQHRLEAIVATPARKLDPAAHLEELKQASQAIEDSAAQLPSPRDPNLAHYLQRCSYDKALQWLEDELVREKTHRAG